MTIGSHLISYVILEIPKKPWITYYGKLCYLFIVLWRNKSPAIIFLGTLDEKGNFAYSHADKK
jgi:hypothetical protein